MGISAAFDRIARWIGRIILGFLLWFLFIQTFVRLVRRYLHFPVPPIVAVFLNSPLRKAMQPPVEVVERSGIEPGMNVLELGCGPGTFTVDAARRIGDTGRLLAVDIEPKMIEKANQAIWYAGLNNVDIRMADAYNLPAPDESIDVAFMVTVLAEVPDRQKALAEVRRVLKPDGTLSITELFTDPDYPRQQTVVRWCRDAGFRLTGGHGNFFNYTLNFQKDTGDWSQSSDSSIQLPD
ncbi:MAG TPA: methyltransferase domain-containing protein [Chloroflexota bacterium]|nr:methyltransferase domain-containing protein [Chloroflexota bacterium]